MTHRQAVTAFAVLAATLTGLSALAGCAGAASTDATPTGTVTGSFEMVGGPVTLSGTTPSHPLSGTVTATSGGVTRHASAGTDGAFTLVVPVGTYTLSGTSPQMDSGQSSCTAASPVTVVEGGTTHADIICAVP
jgi:hypothetical protein